MCKKLKYFNIEFELKLYLMDRQNKIKQIYIHEGVDSWNCPNKIVVELYEISVCESIRTLYYRTIKEIFLPEFGVSINLESNLELNSNGKDYNIFPSNYLRYEVIPNIFRKPDKIQKLGSNSKILKTIELTDKSQVERLFNIVKNTIQSLGYQNQIEELFQFVNNDIF